MNSAALVPGTPQLQPRWHLHSDSPASTVPVRTTPLESFTSRSYSQDLETTSSLSDHHVAARVSTIPPTHQVENDSGIVLSGEQIVPMVDISLDMTPLPSSQTLGPGGFDGSSLTRIMNPDGLNVFLGERISPSTDLRNEHTTATSWNEAISQSNQATNERLSVSEWNHIPSPAASTSGPPLSRVCCQNLNLTSTQTSLDNVRHTGTTTDELNDIQSNNRNLMNLRKHEKNKVMKRADVQRRRTTNLQQHQDIPKITFQDFLDGEEIFPF